LTDSIFFVKIFTLNCRSFWPPNRQRHAFGPLGKKYACMLDTKKKQQVIKKYAVHEGDTGSSEVQIAILTSEIEELIKHLKMHPKDHSSRRGLLRKVSTRRRLMRYLKKENPESYEELVKKLKIKKSREIKNLNSKEEEEEDVLEEEIIESENEVQSE